MEKEYKHTCFRCGKEFVITHYIETDKPTCHDCFKVLLQIDNLEYYNDFITKKDYSK